MAAKKSYNRFFIIFQEEDKGYGMGPDRPPTGYAKVETRSDKSKVTVYVQNLKPFESGDFLYKCYLISHQDNKDCTAYLGIVNIDDLGRGESSWETSAENAFDSKTPIDRFNGAAIVVENDSLPGIIAPLAGYMSKEKFDWRSRIPSIKKEQEVIKEDTTYTGQALQEEVKYPEAAIFEEYEKSIEKVEGIEDVHDTIADNTPGVEKIEDVTADNTPDVEKIQDVIADNTPDVEIKQDITDNTHGIEEIQDIIVESDNASNVEANEDLITDNMDMFIPEREDKYAEEEGIHEMDASDVEDAMFGDVGTGLEDEGQDIFMEEETEDEPRHVYKGKKEHKEHKYGYPGCMHCSGYDYRHIMRKMLEDILEDYEKLDKHNDMKDCKLWKVDMGKYRRDWYKVTMYPCYDLLFYPILLNPYYGYMKHIKKHGHYIFGIKQDKDGKVIALIYGMPGKRNKSEQPYMGSTGFTKWIPWDENHGYWIMMYDPMTGIIVTHK